MNDAQAMKDTHVVIAALRNSYEHLAIHLAGWLGEALAFEDQGDFDEAAWSHFWVAIGVEPQFVELLLKLRMEWRNEKLVVCIPHRDRPGVFEDVSMLVMGLMRFENLSDSRWLGAGPACRCLLRSLAVGLDSLVRFVRRDASVSEYHIRGFSKLTKHLRRFIALASIVSFIPEVVQTELLGNPRVPMRAEALQSLMSEEADWVLNLPEAFCSRLEATTGTCRSLLQHEAASAAMVCCAFLERRLFRAARQLPWRLCRGSIIDNLKELRDQKEPAEDLANKLWQLLRLGYPLQQLEQAVELLRSCPWSIG